MLAGAPGALAELAERNVLVWSNHIDFRCKEGRAIRRHWSTSRREIGSQNEVKEKGHLAAAWDRNHRGCRNKPAGPCEVPMRRRSARATGARLCPSGSPSAVHSIRLWGHEDKKHTSRHRHEENATTPRSSKDMCEQPSSAPVCAPGCLCARTAFSRVLVCADMFVCALVLCAISRSAALCCAVLCCAVPCHAVPCCAVLCVVCVHTSAPSATTPCLPDPRKPTVVDQSCRIRPLRCADRHL